MLISKANRKAIYENLFKEGVLVAQKDFNAPKHLELDVPNLQVIKACQSLTSRGYVKTSFSWQYYYYTLTNEGIDYLREYLHLPSEIVPATHKKQVRAPRPGQSAPRGDAPYRAPRGGDEGYRRRGDDSEKKEGAGSDFRPRYLETAIKVLTNCSIMFMTTDSLVLDEELVHHHHRLSSSSAFQLFHGVFEKIDACFCLEGELSLYNALHSTTYDFYDLLLSC